MLTLAEYLEDYASAEVKERGYKSIEYKLENGDITNKANVIKKLERIKKGERDLYF